MKFVGSWDVNIMLGVLGTHDLLDGRLEVASRLKATRSYVEFKGNAYVSWNILGFSGSDNLDVGFRLNI